MSTSALLKKVRKIEIKTKGLSNHIFAGEYHTAFKGKGMAFSEVREYQLGDDIRSIDWNVTARYNAPFVKVFEEVAKRLGPFEWLAQGTLYPDVIESGKSGGPAARIKTHHNVRGLPERLGFKLLEPLKDLYKDEVRRMAAQLNLPEKLVKKHPFPGPGLAARIIGKVTEEKLKVCREASWIVEDVLREHGLYDEVWQAFAIVGDDLATGVKGDRRAHGRIVIVRVVVSEDAMTADWAKLPYDVLDEISKRITNEIPEVTWVAYAVTSKPPSTIEPQ